MGPYRQADDVYEGGVFKPLQEVDLREGTKAYVFLKPGRITNIARKYRVKVDCDVMSEFIEERCDSSRYLDFPSRLQSKI